MPSRLACLFATLFSLMVLPACGTRGGPDGVPVQFEQPASPHAGVPYPNWPVPPQRAEQLLGSGTGELVEAEGAGGGTTGAERMTVRYPAGEEFKIKWKLIPGDLDGFNNSPRKELAAYQIQRIFLDPEDYVVPTTEAVCVALDKYRKVHPGANPTLPGTNCVLGVVALWMKEVTVPDELYDEGRFRSDATYAYFMSNLNLLTYVIQHKDGRSGNFLASKDDGRRQVFAVDNGISFGPWVFNYFVPNWNDLRVAALRKESVDRLRRIRPEDLQFLATVVQLEPDEHGILRSVEPGPPLDPGDGARRQGTTVQLGLDRSEIEGAYQRIQELIEKVDAGEIPVF